MSLDFQQDHFALLGLAPDFAIDTAELDRAYRQLQAKVHPDRHAAATDVDRRLAMPWATRVNEAYRTLKPPLARARYLLSLRGVDTEEETNTSMPTDFLLQQLAWREEVVEARTAGNAEALVAQARALQGTEQGWFDELAQALQPNGDLARAALLVRMLRFTEKLHEEIDDALEVVDESA